MEQEKQELIIDEELLLLSYCFSLAFFGPDEIWKRRPARDLPNNSLSNRNPLKYWVKKVKEEEEKESSEQDID